MKNPNEKQQEVINALATAWDLYNKIPEEEKHPDDTPDFKKCIHDAQRIMFTQWKHNEMREQEEKESQDIDRDLKMRNIKHHHHNVQLSPQLIEHMLGSPNNNQYEPSDSFEPKKNKVY